jgi:deoxyribose-phosphate aldolase
MEARNAARDGGREVDMVINIGRAKSGKWDYVANEIRCVNEAVVGEGAILKVIFENDCMSLSQRSRRVFCYLTDTLLLRS